MSDIRLVVVLYDHMHCIEADTALQYAKAVLDIAPPLGVVHFSLARNQGGDATSQVALRAHQLARAAGSPVVLMWRRSNPQTDRLRYGVLAYADVCVQVRRISSGSLPIEARLVKHPTQPVVPIEWEV